MNLGPSLYSPRLQAVPLRIDNKAMAPVPRRALAASAAIVGAALLACAAVVGRYRQQTALEQFLLVPMNGPMLFSHPGGLFRVFMSHVLCSFRAAACVLA